MSTNPPRKKRRLAITLRGMLVLVLIVGLILGWRINKARDRRRAAEMLRASGGNNVHYDWEFIDGKFTRSAKIPGPEWLRKLIGDEFFQTIVWADIGVSEHPEHRHEDRRKLDRVLEAIASLDSLRDLMLGEFAIEDAHIAQVRELTSVRKFEVWNAPNLTEAGIAHLRGATHFKTIEINDCKLTDASLPHFAEIPSLEALDIRGNALTVAGLVHLAKLSRLKKLGLGWGKNVITDAGMPAIARIKSLETLDLSVTKVGDAGLMTLASLPNLKEISINGSEISTDGIARFQKLRPGVRVRP